MYQFKCKFNHFICIRNNLMNSIRQDLQKSRPTTHTDAPSWMHPSLHVKVFHASLPNSLCMEVIIPHIPGFISLPFFLFSSTVVKINEYCSTVHAFYTSHDENGFMITHLFSFLLTIFAARMRCLHFNA